jgi:serine/threonine protein kinase
VRPGVTAYGKRHVASSKPPCPSCHRFAALQEFCNGGSLRCAVNEGCFGPGNARGRWRLILSILRDIAAGMEHMHGKRLCHGDLNPANVLLKARAPLQS